MSPGGKTPWPATSVDGILDIGLSMDSGSATDAAAKLRAAMQAIANAAAVYERTVHTISEHLEGAATTAALTTAGRVARAAVENASNAGAVGAQLDEVAAILGSGRSAAEVGAHEVRAAANPALSGTVQPLAPSRARAVKAQLDAAMDGTYSNPMVGAHALIDVTPVNDLDLPGGGTHNSGGEIPSTATTFDSNPSAGSDPAGPVALLGSRGGPQPESTSRISSPPEITEAVGTPIADTTGPGTGPAGSGPSTPVTPAAGAAPLGPAGGLGAARGATSAGRAGGTRMGIGGINAAQPPSPTSRLATPGVAGKPSPVSMPAAAAPTAQRGALPPAHPGGSRASARSNEHHRAAGYLRGRHHSEAAIGPLPLVAPPVLGDWRPPDADADPARTVDSDVAQRDRS